MSHKYNPTAQELRDAYSVAYGDLGDTMLIGGLFGYLVSQKADRIEMLYAQALEQIKKDLVEKELA